jgi:hypothetical protein
MRLVPAWFVQRRQDPGRQVRRAAAIDEFEELVQVHALLMGQ